MKNEREPFLQVEDLVVEYTSDGDTVHAINGVTFSLEKGKTLALVGETGAGKTTIAKSILRILPDRAARIVSGNVAVDGQNLLRISEKEMREVRGRKISMVFQDPMTALNPTMRVGEQIAEVIRIHNRVSKTEAAKMATEMLQMVGITPERYGEYPHQFSGGMKQRVIIAMALACTPELLLADEPTTALDVTIQAQILEMIAELRKKYNTSMLLITHDLGIVAANADEVAVIYAGQILEYGSVDVVFNNPLILIQSDFSARFQTWRRIPEDWPILTVSLRILQIFRKAAAFHRDVRMRVMHVITTGTNLKRLNRDICAAAEICRL